jgi:hypothetical protein
MCGVATERSFAVPHNMPEPRGHGVVTSVFVDADHAGCKPTRRSHTGVFVFVIKALILWHSKHQNTVETSTFISEYCNEGRVSRHLQGARCGHHSRSVGERCDEYSGFANEVDAGSETERTGWICAMVSISQN